MARLSNERDVTIAALIIFGLLLVGLVFVGDEPMPPPATEATIPAPTVPTTSSTSTTEPLALNQGAVVTEQAVRSTERIQYETLPPPPTTSVAGGLKNLPFAPPELGGCERMAFYLEQAGLPADFEWIGWAESRCLNDVSTWCCHGYFQIHHIHIGDGSATECDVRTVDDFLGANGLDRQRNACMAARVLRQQGVCAWDVVRC